MTKQKPPYIPNRTIAEIDGKEYYLATGQKHKHIIEVPKSQAKSSPNLLNKITDWLFGKKED
jgi:hypothetical protein